MAECIRAVFAPYAVLSAHLLWHTQHWVPHRNLKGFSHDFGPGLHASSCARWVKFFSILIVKNACKGCIRIRGQRRYAAAFIFDWGNTMFFGIGVGVTLLEPLGLAAKVTFNFAGLVTSAEVGRHAQTGQMLTVLPSTPITNPRWQRHDGIGWSDIPSATGLSYAPTINVDGVIDQSFVRFIGTFEAEDYASQGYAVLHIAPVAEPLPPVVATFGDGAIDVPLSASFIGQDLIFTTNDAQATITGDLLTIADVVRDDTMTITATNSGGSVTTSLDITISQVAGTTWVFTNQGNGSFIFESTGTMPNIALNDNGDSTFTRAT